MSLPIAQVPNYLFNDYGTPEASANRTPHKNQGYNQFSSNQQYPNIMNIDPSGGYKIGASMNDRT